MFNALIKQEKVLNKEEIKKIQSIKIKKTKNPFKKIINIFKEDEKVQEKLNLFQKLKTITHKLPPLTKEELGGDIYILNKFLSMNKEYLPTISILTKYLFIMNSYDYYMLLYNILPKSKKFIEYKKKNKIKIDMELKKLLKKKFCCNEEDLEDIIKILFKQGETESSLKNQFGLN